VARAFVKDAPILILDEPTSSIDSRTEAAILEALDRLMVGRTTFLIAHRLSTVRNADLILTMDQGRIVEQGSHADLLRQKGLYKQLHDLHTGMLRRRFRPLSPSAATLPDPDAQSPYRVEWLDHWIPARMAAGQEHAVGVRVRNTGTQCWSSHPDRHDCTSHVFVSYHWLHPEGDETVLFDGSRTALSRDVGAGDTVEVSDVVVVAPDQPGPYRLQLTLVHEFVTWFEEQGADTLIVAVDVSNESEGIAAALGAPELPSVVAIESA
jgi:hypothetical protein